MLSCSHACLHPSAAVVLTSSKCCAVHSLRAPPVLHKALTNTVHATRSPTRHAAAKEANDVAHGTNVALTPEWLVSPLTRVAAADPGRGQVMPTHTEDTVYTRVRVVGL